MVLRRLGNKKAVAKNILPHFPEHKIYIEPFFGAGGMFFKKPKVRYNIVNDSDSDVFNLFMVIMERKEELVSAFKIMPVHQDLLNYWKNNKEVEPIRKALRFLFLSNMTYMLKGNNLVYHNRNKKEFFYKKIDETWRKLSDVMFNNCDFRIFFKSICFEDKPQHFIYNDPPYLDTDTSYECGTSWSEQDVLDLFDANENTGCKYAISEFDHPFLIEQAKKRDLNIIQIGERKNVANRRTEMLYTNYASTQLRMF